MLLFTHHTIETFFPSDRSDLHWYKRAKAAFELDPDIHTIKVICAKTDSRFIGWGEHHTPYGIYVWVRARKRQAGAAYGPYGSILSDYRRLGRNSSTEV